MKIKMSKSQWEDMGKKTGWMKKEASKIADHEKFHDKWENLQKKMGIVLSLAHDDPWVTVDRQYKQSIDDAINALKSLYPESLDN
jgi:hypothetical protein